MTKLVAVHEIGAGQPVPDWMMRGYSIKGYKVECIRFSDEVTVLEYDDRYTVVPTDWAVNGVIDVKFADASGHAEPAHVLLYCDKKLFLPTQYTELETKPLDQMPKEG